MPTAIAKLKHATQSSIVERTIRMIEALTSVVGGIAAVLVIPLMLATAWEVFARYV